MKPLKVRVVGQEKVLYALERIEHKLDQLIHQGAHTMADLSAVNANLDQLEQNVAANTDATASATQLLDELAQLLRDNSSDQEAINAIADRIAAASAGASAGTSSLADAVLRNTDVDPTPGGGNGGEPTNGGGETPA